MHGWPDSFCSCSGGPPICFPSCWPTPDGSCTVNGRCRTSRSRLNTLLRAAGFVLTLFTSCGLATLHWDGSALPNSAGGVLGELVGQDSAEGLSFLGATLLLLGLWFAGVALFLGVSWFEVMDKLGAYGLARHRLGSYQDGTAARARFRTAAQAGAPGGGARRAEEGREPSAAAHRAAGADAAARASGSSASARCRCSMRPNRASCPRCRCSMSRVPASSPIPTRPWRRCRAWSS